jgi:hypothetical protein
LNLPFSSFIARHKINHITSGYISRTDRVETYGMGRFRDRILGGIVGAKVRAITVVGGELKIPWVRNEADDQIPHPHRHYQCPTSSSVCQSLDSRHPHYQPAQYSCRTFTTYKLHLYPILKLHLISRLARDHTQVHRL